MKNTNDDVDFRFRWTRARLQPPRCFTPAGSSARAVPAGVATFR